MDEFYSNLYPKKAVLGLIEQLGWYLNWYSKQEIFTLSEDLLHLFRGFLIGQIDAICWDRLQLLITNAKSHEITPRKDFFLPALPFPLCPTCHQVIPKAKLQIESQEEYLQEKASLRKQL